MRRKGMPPAQPPPLAIGLWSGSGAPNRIDITVLAPAPNDAGAKRRFPLAAPKQDFHFLSRDRGQDSLVTVF